MAIEEIFYQTLLHQLEKKTLPEVTRIMAEEHDFHPT